MRIEARDDARTWNTAIEFHARSLESGCRTAARKLGLSGRILTRERVGSEQWLVNVDGQRMHVIAHP